MCFRIVDQIFVLNDVNRRGGDLLPMFEKLHVFRIVVAQPGQVVGIMVALGEIVCEAREATIKGVAPNVHIFGFGKELRVVTMIKDIANAFVDDMTSPICFLCHMINVIFCDFRML